ncbi:glycoside hydrolase family 2 protein [Microbacterium sp. SS28]|uniref:glycoside hydrolase family 2 protein n=1 Tax=Microbacterium sp. SS28 TaxID=2919948 RepID=UPI001FAB263A|nr:glycoside hydrolase family 2 TIM barrel-domain containing protein [Microbacterium sp. SS28]
MRDEELRASAQDGTYPRPQLVRPRWFDLSGEWDFAFDEDVSVDPRAGVPAEFARTIVVPYPPESPLSGIHETGYHPVVWYRRYVDASDVARAGHADGRTLLLHFGAVDYRADVWIDGRQAASHEGGHTPFTVEVPVADVGFEIVVRAEDDPHDLSQPRGKQDWQEAPHSIWYHRTTGIWQPVWIESVPRQHVTRVAWHPDVRHDRVHLTLELASRPVEPVRAHVTLRFGARLLAETTVTMAGPTQDTAIAIPALGTEQGWDELLWRPDRPVLIDARIELTAGDPTAASADVVSSYLGLRFVETVGGDFLLNGARCHVKGVLSQGYWPQSHLAAPGAAALRAEVELIKDLGFNTARLHQKVEDPRLMYWADRLGLLLWTELPSAFENSDAAVTRLTKEWMDVVRRDSSHPSVVAWVPLNESWAVRQIAVDARQQDFARTLYHLTKTLDGTRPVISNDGWEHTQSDLLTMHDYENDHVKLRARYGTPEAVAKAVEGLSPFGKRVLVGTDAEAAATASTPALLTEFGGVSFTPDPDFDAWGYRLVGTPDDLDRHLTGIFAVLNTSTGLAGWVYTQLTDTVQETNGLVDENRVPKLPVERIRAILHGRVEPAG